MTTALADLNFRNPEIDGIRVRKLNDLLSYVRATSAITTDPTIIAFAGLVGAVDQVPYFTDADTMGLTTFTAFGRTLAAAADAATGRTNLGLVAIASSGSASDLSAGTVPAARMPALTGDATTVAGAVAVTLATVNSNVGSWGSATQVGTFAVDGKGRTTAAANVTITPAVGSITGLGTGVATALGVAIGSAGAFVTFNGAGGTPSSLTLTNATGLTVAGGGTGIASYAVGDLLYASTATVLSKLADVATGNVLISGGVTTAPSWGKAGISTHISGLGTGVAAFLATPSSANLAAALTDETGGGALVFAASPAFTGTAAFAALSTSGDVTFGGSLIGQADNVYFGLDGSDTTPRVGWTKKSGALAKLTFGSAAQLTIAQSSAASIAAAGTFTDIATFSGTGLAVSAVSVAGQVSVSGNVLLNAANLTIYAATGDVFMRAGAGGSLQLGANGTNGLAVLSGTALSVTGNITSTGFVRTGSYTVANLPAAATAGSGARAFVTDATATTFASTVAGGGANKVPVYSDGTNWKIG